MPSSLEIIVLEIHEYIMQKPFFLVHWYRPPSSKSDVFHSFEETIELMYSQKRNILILGDINCDMLNPNQWHNDQFKFLQLISEPTLITKDSKTLLDLI